MNDSTGRLVVCHANDDGPVAVTFGSDGAGPYTRSKNCCWAYSSGETVAVTASAASASRRCSVNLA